jgi:NADPH-ferrihemoprotein reductase
MANDVNKQLESTAMQIGKLSETAAKQWVKNLRSKGRYLEDVWS